MVGSVAAVFTLSTGSLVWFQTRKHFRLIRASEYIQRFNSKEFFDARILVDTFHQDETLLAAVLEGETSSNLETVRVRATILRFANLFQELGGSYLKRTVDRHYIWTMFGYLAQVYWKRFEPVIQALRNSRNRPQLYCDFEAFASEMRRLDTKYSPKVTHSVSTRTPAPVFVFAYGSLVSPASIAKSLGKDSKGEVRAAWLYDYRRSWTALIPVQPIGSKEPNPTIAAFLNVTLCEGAIVNGVLFPASETDLSILDQREFIYRRVDVSQLVRPKQTGTVYVYVTDEQKADAGSAYVPTEYLRIIEEAFEYWGQGFKEEFWRRTASHSFRPLEGQYRFLRGGGGDKLDSQT